MTRRLLRWLSLRRRSAAWRRANPITWAGIGMALFALTWFGVQTGRLDLEPSDVIQSGVDCQRRPNHPHCRSTPGPLVETPTPPALTATATQTVAVITPTVEPATPTAMPTTAPTVAATPSAAPTATATAIAATPTPSAAPVAPCLGAPAYPEVRPANTAANATMGHPLDPSLLQADVYTRGYLSRVTGACVGTTEQILEWALLKWFPEFDHDLFKAQAVKESYWNQDAQGDWNGTAFESFGIMQVRMKYWCPVAGCEQVVNSTAFGADVAAAVMRAHYDGALYSATRAYSTTGNLRRSVNAWYAGDGASHWPADWSVNQDGSVSEYACMILGGTINEPGSSTHGQTLQGYLAAQPWKGW